MTREAALSIRRWAMALTALIGAGAWSIELLEVKAASWLVITGSLALIITFWTAVILTLKLRSPTWPLENAHG
ncbi:hypothetical protein [Sphingomonas sp. LT1P40]|uniref:hypothetical protein n=1 Tax=Alteristakelama amylovorans TaxID=3096166 RepID=UPI002FCA5219